MVELVADKLPKTPSRTAPPGLIARIVMGGLTGACVATSGTQGVLPGALLGAAGGVVGCFGGFQARTRLVKASGTADIYVALIEDIVGLPAPCGLFRDSELRYRAFRRRLSGEKNFPRRPGRAQP